MAKRKRKSERKQLERGFTCKCGVWEKFPAYVFAHYREDLTFTCPQCQRQWSIRDGVATFLRDLWRK